MQEAHLKNIICEESQPHGEILEVLCGDRLRSMEAPDIRVKNHHRREIFISSYPTRMSWGSEMNHLAKFSPKNYEQNIMVVLSY